jgi:dihydrofolate reductase / thymidylate synthase
MHCAIVVAASDSGGIGFAGGLPWPRIPGDSAHFARVTSAVSVPGARNAVVMGRTTWESLPESARPLPGRLNIVVSSALAAPPDVLVVPSLSAALVAARLAKVERVFIAGGARLYQEALVAPEVTQVVLTRVRCPGPFDVVVPELATAELEGAPDAGLWEVVHATPDVDGEASAGVLPQHRFVLLRRRAETGVARKAVHPEAQYLDLVAQVLTRGEPRADRTGVGTRALFAPKAALLEFSLADGVLPLLTTKRVAWTAVAEELLWFLQGCTDARALEAKGVRIWSANGSRAALDARGLTHYREGDLGPVYGFQWRHFGAAYEGADADYTNKGVDQVQALVTGLRADPVGRRHILSAWNPADLGRMALPPCHMMSQFWVGAGGLHCLMAQRSGDLGLGVPFNIASYALLTRLVAAAVGIPAARLCIVVGDAHVYNTHVEALTTQLGREPREFPVLELHPPPEAVAPDGTVPIDVWRLEHFKVVGYTPHGPLPMPMAV